MLKGLEVSEITLKQLNAEFRIDAEYFLKDDLAALKRLNDFGAIEIGDCVTDGIHTSIDYDDKSSVRLLSAQSPRENYIDLSRDARISLEAHTANPRTALRVNDVIVSVVGTIGNCAVVRDEVLPANCDRDIAIIRNPGCNPFVLSTFLLCKYGRCQMLRETTGNVQQHLFLYKIRGLRTPCFEQELQNQLAQLVRRCYDMRLEANAIYCDAEECLLGELGLVKWNPVGDSVSVKSFSEVSAAGRIDAEYFQPKFDEIEARIRKRAADVLCAADALIAGLCKSDDEKVERYIELADIGASGTVENCTKAEFADLPSRARQRVSEGQVIVSSIEGSLKSCALITSEFDGALCSTGFHRFQTGKINPETLLLLFKSWPIQELLKRGCSGTILSGISADSLANVPLPILPQRIQSILADKVRESFRLRNESKRLLDLAKSAVELAIEKGEDVAMKQLSKSKV